MTLIMHGHPAFKHRTLATMRALFVKSSFQNLVHVAVWISRRGRVVIPANRCLAQVRALVAVTWCSRSVHKSRTTVRGRHSPTHTNLGGEAECSARRMTPELIRVQRQNQSSW